ncbi:MAG: helix-turn-helix domain-containing protein [Verrucomicrobiales bacterium]
MEFLINQRFKDFDLLLTMARTWDLDFVQLDRGEAEFQLTHAGIGGCQIARARFDRMLLQRGQAPPGMRTFVIPVKPDSTLEWRGRRVGGCDLLVFPEGGELASCSPAGFDMITYSVPVHRLDQMCEELQLPDLAQMLSGREVVSLEEKAMAKLRWSFLRCTTALEAASAIPRAAGLREEVGKGLASEILLVLANGHLRTRSLPSARQQSACLDSAMRIIEGCGAVGLSVQQLCRETGVSERTLQYAFRGRFQLGPKAFLQAWRLNRVRRDLSVTSPRQLTISDVANRYGFWHLGQFAADYRRQYGELPSGTRERVLSGG